MREFNKILYSDPFFDYEICEFHEKPEKGVLVKFDSIYDITEFLMRLMCDFDDIRTLKSLLANNNCWHSISYLDDHAVAQKIGNEILMGRINIVRSEKDRLYDDCNIVFGSDKTAAPLQTESIGVMANDWIEIEIVDEDDNPLTCPLLSNKNSSCII